MKKIFTILVAVLFSAGVYAQSPEKISYQAVVRDANDNLVSNKNIGIQLSILRGSIVGSAVFIERHFQTTNKNGLVSLEIGTGTIVSGDFITIDWANDVYFIKSETDLNGGSSYTITGTSQMLSVPYALYAKTAETITGTIAETDPVFGASVASGITGTDTTNWNNKLDSYTETDPIFGASVASGITGTDITNWNNNYVPAGVLTMFGGSAPPSGYLLCDGSAVSRVTYANLFAAIGETYGAGNGSTTFNLPDLRGKVPVGLNTGQVEFNSLNKSGGEITHVLSTAEMPTHSHTGTTNTIGEHTHTGNVNASGSHTHDVSMSGAQSSYSTTTAPDTYAMPYIRDADGSTYNDGAYDELRFYDGGSYHQPYDLDFLELESADNVTTSSSTTHTHSFTTGTSGSHYHNITLDNTGSNTPHNNLQPYIVVNYIIKY